MGRIAERLEWRSSGSGRLERFRNIHNNKRCFIIGNGPSLKEMDLSILAKEFTFGLNRIYILFPEIGFSTSYLVCINNLVLQQCAAEIQGLDCVKFVNWNEREIYNPDENLYFMRMAGTEKFHTDLSRGIWQGGTVTFAAMQIAYYMGFSDVVLIGVDHNFETKGDAGKVVISDGDDPNHFHPDYFGKGFKWQLPNLEKSEVAYNFARRQYEKAGRRIVDATVGGKLQVFTKVDYRGLF